MCIIVSAVKQRSKMNVTYMLFYLQRSRHVRGVKDVFSALFIMLTATYIDSIVARHSYVRSEAAADDRLAKRFLRNLSTR